MTNFTHRILLRLLLLAIIATPRAAFGNNSGIFDTTIGEQDPDVQFTINPRMSETVKATPCTRVTSSESASETYHAVSGICMVGPGVCEIYGSNKPAGNVDRSAHERNIYVQRSAHISDTSKDKGLNFPKIPLAYPIGVSEDSCFRAPLPAEITWLSTAIWVDGLNQILIVNPKQGALLYVDLRGNLANGLPDGSAAENNDSPPIDAVENGSGYVVRLADSTILEFNGRMQLEKRGNLLSRQHGAQRNLGSLYQWHLTKHGVYGYGALLDGKDRFTMGFVGSETRSDGTREALMILPFSRHKFYLLGNVYIASIGSDVFFLAMDQHPTIYRYSPVTRQTDLVYEARQEFDYLEDLASSIGPRSVEELYAEVETRSMPVGLYADSNYLYMLARRPASSRYSVRPNSETDWWLYKINPEKGEVMGLIQFPTTANHITLVQSPANWHIIEKGPVLSNGLQEVKHLLTLPGKWIQDYANSPLNGRGKQVECEMLTSYDRFEAFGTIKMDLAWEVNGKTNLPAYDLQSED